MKIILLFCGSRLKDYNLNWVDRSKVKIIGIFHEENFKKESKKTLAKCNDIIVAKSILKSQLFEFDKTDLIIKINEHIKKHKLSDILVVCSNEDDILIAGEVREHFSISGMKHDKAIIFRNKVKMKSFLRDKQILLPKFVEIELTQLSNDKYFDEISQKITVPFIIKPTSSAGGYGVYTIHSKKDLALMSSQLVNKVGLEYQAEEYLSGPLYHCDIIVSKQKVVFAECGLYNHNYFGADVKHAVIGSAALHDESADKKTLINLCTAIVKKMGFFDGSYHGEFFKRDHSFVFLEIAARPAGAMICHMYEKMYETNILDLDFAAQSNLSYMINLKRKYYAVWACFVAHKSGKLLNKYNIEDIPKNAVKWYVKKNHNIHLSNYGLALVGALLYKNKNYQKINNINQLMSRFHPFEIG